MKIEYQLIKKFDDFINNEEQFENMLETNNDIRIDKDKKIIVFKENYFEYSIGIKLDENIKEITIIFCVENENEFSIESIYKLEKFNNKLMHILECYCSGGMGFKVNILEDDISYFYCQEIYPKIHRLENKLRKIIYLIMQSALGSNWIEKALPNSVSKYAEKGKIESSDFLYHFDFIALGSFLFDKYTDEEAIRKRDDLDGSIDKFTKVEIENIIKNAKPKSNYDRFFSRKLDSDKLKEMWEELYIYRNKVAHNKIMRKSDYDRCIKLIGKLDVKFDQCIKKIKNVKFSVDDIAGLKTFSETLSKFYLKSLTIPYIEALKTSSNIMDSVVKGIKSALEASNYSKRIYYSDNVESLESKEDKGIEENSEEENNDEIMDEK